MSNPEFAKMAESLGKKMFENNPNLAGMLGGQQQSPEMRAAMEDKMRALKEDPEIAPILEDLEKGGPAAMMKYWSDPEAMGKLAQAFEGMPGINPAGTQPLHLLPLHLCAFVLDARQRAPEILLRRLPCFSV